MRKLLAGLIIFTIVNFANSVKWLGNYDRALSRAKKEHKALLVLLVKRGDSFSKKIVAKYFTNREYINIINKKSVAVILYFNEKTSYPIELLYTIDFPTIFLLNPNRETFINEPLYGKNINDNSILEFIKKL